MAFFAFALLCGFFQMAFCGEPVVNCPAPRSPDHGQAFLYQDGKVVKYVCEPGYVLRGKELVRCVDGKWEDEFTTCLKFDDGNGVLDEFPKDVLLPPLPPSRPLFSWGKEDDSIDEPEQNSTSDDGMPMSDEARLRMVLYPRRRARIITTRVRPAKIHSVSELEDEEKKRSDSKKEKPSATTIRLESPPSSIYVRRTVTPGKVESQEHTLNQQYRTASVHMAVENTGDNDHVQVLLPRAAATQNDKGEDALRQMYYWAHYNYPRSASLAEYRSGSPVSMTLSESQIAWINSLHPELRDQYLRDLHVVRAEEAMEGARAQAFLRRYEDAYNLYHHAPYYYRQPASLRARDPVSVYDYSCNQAGSYFVTAPKLRNAHIARYDRRQNPNAPRNHYLTTVYRCDPGFEMLDTRFTELHCSQRSWIGTEPVCIPRS